jgi:hypothetical protein
MATATSAPGDRVAAATRTERHLSTATKAATKTTEFYAYVAATVGVLLAGLLTKVGDGYMISRLWPQSTRSAIASTATATARTTTSSWPGAISTP